MMKATTISPLSPSYHWSYNASTYTYSCCRPYNDATFMRSTWQHYNALATDDGDTSSLGLHVPPGVEQGFLRFFGAMVASPARSGPDPTVVVRYSDRTTGFFFSILFTNPRCEHVRWDSVVTCLQGENHLCVHWLPFSLF